MKFFFALLVAFTSTLSFATTCFKATKQLPIESFLPEEVCVESVNLELINPGLPKTPFYQGTAITNVGTIKKTVTFYDFQKAPFTVSLPIGIHENGGWCDEYVSSKIIVEFKVDAQGAKIEDSIQVKGKFETSRDLCHDQPRGPEFTYEKI